MGAAPCCFNFVETRMVDIKEEIQLTQCVDKRTINPWEKKASIVHVSRIPVRSGGRTWHLMSDHEGL